MHRTTVLSYIVVPLVCVAGYNIHGARACFSVHSGIQNKHLVKHVRTTFVSVITLRQSEKVMNDQEPRRESRGRETPQQREQRLLGEENGTENVELEKSPNRGSRGCLGEENGTENVELEKSPNRGSRGCLGEENGTENVELELELEKPPNKGSRGRQGKDNG